MPYVKKKLCNEYFWHLASLLLLSNGCVTHLYALFFIQHSAGNLTIYTTCSVNGVLRFGKSLINFQMYKGAMQQAMPKEPLPGSKNFFLLPFRGWGLQLLLHPLYPVLQFL